MQALLAATLRGDAEAVIDAYWPWATVAEQGVMTPRFDSLASGLRAYYAGHRVLVNALDAIQVRALGSDTAVFTAHYHFGAEMPDGGRMDADGIWTAVFFRSAGEWRIAAAHQCTGP